MANSGPGQIAKLKVMSEIEIAVEFLKEKRDKLTYSALNFVYYEHYGVNFRIFP